MYNSVIIVIIPEFSSFKILSTIEVIFIGSTKIDFKFIIEKIKSGDAWKIFTKTTTINIRIGINENRNPNEQFAAWVFNLFLMKNLKVKYKDCPKVTKVNFLFIFTLFPT